MTHQITLGPEHAGTRQRFEGNDGQDIVVTLDNGFTDGQFLEIVKLPTLTSNLTVVSTYGFIYQLVQTGTVRVTFVNNSPATVGWDYDLLGVTADGGVTAPETSTLLKGDGGGGILATEVRYQLGPDWTGNNYNPTATLTLGTYSTDSTNLTQGMLLSQGNLVVKAANAYSNIGDGTGYNITIVGGNAGYNGTTPPGGGSVIIQPGRTYDAAAETRGSIQLRTQTTYGVTPGTLFIINDSGAFGFAASEFENPPVSNANFGSVGQVLTSRGENGNPEWATSSGSGGGTAEFAVYTINPGAASSFNGAIFDGFSLSAERQSSIIQYNFYDKDLTFLSTGWYEMTVEAHATSTFSSYWPDGLTTFGTNTYGPLITKRTIHTRYGRPFTMGESNQFMPNPDRQESHWTDVFTFKVENLDTGFNNLHLGFFTNKYDPGNETATFGGTITIRRLGDL